jgi:hypothetical protein
MLQFLLESAIMGIWAEASASSGLRVCLPHRKSGRLDLTVTPFYIFMSITISGAWDPGRHVPGLESRQLDHPGCWS